ncbi:MAG: hypothetical protein U5N26_02825 [Candidatus Marinimicrobia bacterium]|nr:hypothetical protein [Candidatus Neomarinimicrobiota bacterium]
MQIYVFGGGKEYEFRFCMREHNSSSGNLFEVSPWYRVDWTGWKLLEWNYHDPLQYGEWSGMTGGSLDGTKYNFDSIHLRPAGENPEAPVTSYVDQLRLVEKADGLPDPNLPPVIGDIPDTTTMTDEAIYMQADVQ